MIELLTYGILLVGGVFLALTTWIVFNKARRESAENWRRERRLALEPLVLAYAHGKNGSLATSLEVGLDARELGVLETVLLDHARLVRGIESRRLSRALDELGFVDGYLERLGDTWWWRRAEAAEKLGLSGAQRALMPLSGALDDSMAEVRMRAANALGRLGGKASVRQLIRALGEPSRWSVIRVADILSRMGPHVAGELTHVFAELSVPGKLAALDVLARIRPLDSARWLIARLADPQRDVRARACNALGSLGDPVAGPALIQALGDKQWPVRSMAAKALGRMHHGAAITALCRALRDPHWWVRSNAADALKAMGPRGLESLERMVEDRDRYARHQVVLKLQEMGVVDERINDLVEPPGPRHDAAETLVLRMVAAGRTARLRALASGHADWRVRRALHVLLPPESGAA